MITRLNKNVICIKDIPSNLIEEAIFILKTEEASPIKKKCKDIIMNEADAIIKECSSKLQEEVDKRRTDEIKARNKLKKIKVNAITIACVFVVVSLIIYLLNI